MIASFRQPVIFRPRLVLAYGDSSQKAALVCRHFRRLGWAVHLASSGCEARRLARALTPEAVLLNTQLRGESGWLTCAKLTMELPRQLVVLTGDPVNDETRRFARFVGASALVSRRADPALIFNAVQSASLAACTP
jgi:DNA-binding response OmpR family regulator